MPSGNRRSRQREAKAGEGGGAARGTDPDGGGADAGVGASTGGSPLEEVVDKARLVEAQLEVRILRA